MHRRTLGYIEEPSDQDPAQGFPVPVLGGGRAGCDNRGPTVSAVERRDSKEALTMDSHISTATAPTRSDSPLDQRYPVGQPRPMGQYPPRRTLPADLAAALWRAREKCGLTNNQVARLVGIDPSYLSKVVRGSRSPSSVTAERLIGVLPLTDDEKEALRAVAVQNAGKSRLPG
jgi:ribosome-binding protein aMBF1 (putative translation factor)